MSRPLLDATTHPNPEHTMRKSIALAILALVATATAAYAAPKKHAKRLPKPTSAAADKFVVDCIAERTGPDGGIPVGEAYKLCKGIVRHQDRITKLAERAAKAIEACEQEVSDACVDACHDAEHGCDCTDEALHDAFDVCTGHGPAWAAKEGK